MNDLTTRTTQLPDTVEDLSQFVLVNEERVQALRAQIRAIKKAKLAKDVYEQKLAEAQEIATVTIEAAQKMGELLKEIPKAAGRPSENSSSHSEKLKSEAAAELGFNRNQVSDFQRMADHPDVVRMVIDKAIESGDIVSRSAVMKQIRELQANKRALEEQNEMLRRQVVEPKVSVVEKVVAPPDYETAKQEAKNAKADFKSLLKQYEEIAEKWKQAEREKEKLIKEKSSPEEQKTERIKLNAVSFCTGVSNFLERFGGYTFLMNEIEALSDKDQKAVIVAITSIYDWANTMLNTTVSEVIE